MESTRFHDSQELTPAHASGRDVSAVPLGSGIQGRPRVCLELLKRTLIRHATRHVRCSLILLLALVSRTGIPLALFGLFNRRLRLVRSVFFCYAGSARYADHYRYRWTSELLRWHPTPIGVFRQGGTWGLVCASPVTEREFTDPAGHADLQKLVSRMSRFRRLLSADHVSFAGILPTYLRRQGLETFDGGAFDRTGQVVACAIREVQKLHFTGTDHDVVLLGGSGRVGQLVHRILTHEGIDAKIVDPAAKTGSCKLTSFDSRPVLIVDLSRRGVLETCLDEIPLHAVILNEVFPEPPMGIRQGLQARGSALYHLAGVTATVYPSLPLGYGGAVPCCAMHSEESIVPVLRRLS